MVSFRDQLLAELLAERFGPPPLAPPPSPVRVRRPEPAQAPVDELALRRATRKQSEPRRQRGVA